jgi:hypothetical protein
MRSSVLLDRVSLSLLKLACAARFTEKRQAGLFFIAKPPASPRLLNEQFLENREAIATNRAAMA